MVTYGKRRKHVMSLFQELSEQPPQKTSGKDEGSFPKLHFDTWANERASTPLGPRIDIDIGTDPIMDYDARDGSAFSPGSILEPLSKSLLSQPSIVIDEVNKPLPPIPQHTHGISNGAETFGTPASANHSAVSGEGEVVSARTLPWRPATPMHVGRTDSQDSDSSNAGSISRPFMMDPPMPADTMALNERLTTLMQQAAAQEAESREKAAILEKHLAEPSPRSRAKRAIARASRAVKNQLTQRKRNRNASDSKQSMDRSNGSYQTLLSDEALVLNSEGQLDDSMQGKLEGLNLNDHQIHSLAEIMGSPAASFALRQRIHSQRLAENRNDPGLAMNDKHRPDESIGKSPPLRSSNNKLLAPASGSTIPSSSLAKERRGRRPIQTPTRSKFDRLVSGLAQHSETMSFSNPVDASTPWDHSKIYKLPERGTKTAQRTNADEEVHKMVEPGRSSLHTNSSSPQIPNILDGTQSVKRKNAQENLRAMAGPALKKMKLAPAGPPQDSSAALANELDKFGTSNERVPLAAKDSNAKMGDMSSKPAKTSSSLRRKGLGIFDVTKPKGKGKNKAPSVATYTQVTSPRVKKPATEKPQRGAFTTRPASIQGLFSRDPLRSSSRGNATSQLAPAQKALLQAHGRMYDDENQVAAQHGHARGGVIAADEMDIDELAM